MKQSELLLIGGIGIGAAAGYFLFFTDEGADMLENIGDAIGIDLDEFFEHEQKEKGRGRTGRGRGRGRGLLGRRRTYGKESDELYIKDRYSTPLLPRGLDPNYYGDDIHYPIQDLFVPPNYYDIKYEKEKYRIPSDEFEDWYFKTSGLKLEDYYLPEHYYWNPDYYYYFGNLQKRWYPNVYDITNNDIPRKRVPYWFGEVYY